MKKLFILAALVAMPVFAADPVPAQPSGDAAKPATEAVKTAASDTKITLKQAKQECKKEGLKGAELKKCIKGKTKH